MRIVLFFRISIRLKPKIKIITEEMKETYLIPMESICIPKI